MHPTPQAGSKSAGAEGTSQGKTTPTTVVHVSEPHDVYIGRAMPGRPASKLQNPYRIGPDGSRDEVLHKFEAYAVEKMTSDPEFAQAVYACKGKRLGCWCKSPNQRHAATSTSAEGARNKKCHGDIIVRRLLGEEPPAEEPPPQLTLF